MEGPKDFSGSEILAKRDFFGSTKDARFFLGCEKTQAGNFFFLLSFISSNQQ